MKILVPAACVFGLASNAQAHVADMPIVVHVTEHGWLFLALIAALAMLSPLFRRRR